jgi:hypothetical protein
VDLSHLKIAVEDWLWPEILCNAINRKLIAIMPPPSKLVAVRWIAKGNLVVTGGTNVTSHSLQIAASYISSTILSSLELPSDAIKSQPRPNVKWSKILLNGMATGTLKNRALFSPDMCHSALAAINLFYTSLSIIQKPS